MNRYVAFILSCAIHLAYVNCLSTILNQKHVSRLSFLKTSTITAAAVFTNSNQALAKGVDPALKGTKEDPEYQACLSKCVYDCTKPKGEEQKSRSECIPECKRKCATTKEQLLTGTPIKPL